ncbi:MAG: folylpolyglutamate synthase/dihydrofolate synthase family protein [Niabella sp.]
MTYDETLDYIYARLPMFSRVGATAIKSGLDNIVALCEALGNPEKKGKFIHVAGTNGKGSVSHMIASVLQSAGYKTGLYTSPHLKDLRERIRINGEMISKENVVCFIEKIRPLIEKIDPSFFEINVAMAFDYFASQETDFAVIETGLGGRLDSTNIITPLISVITNIGYDHVQILGDTLPQIAGEKAGIIKQNIPVVIGEHNAETAPVFIQKSLEKNAAISFADKNWQVLAQDCRGELLHVKVKLSSGEAMQEYDLDLTGSYQSRNLLTVLETFSRLSEIGLRIAPTALANGLKHTKQQTGLHGRWETVQTQPRVVLDVAHNEDGMKQVLAQLDRTDFDKLFIVLGMVRDKDVDKVLSLLPPQAEYFFTQAALPRALEATELQAKATKYHLSGKAYKNVNDAIAFAKTKAQPNDLILVCGSVFLVGEVE